MSPRHLPSSLMLLATALVAVAFLPGTRSWAFLWWCAGLVVMVLALLVARRTHASHGRRSRHRSAASVPVVVAVAASLTAFGAPTSSMADVPPVDLSPDLTTAAPLDVSSGAAVDPATSGALLATVSSTAERLEPVTGTSRDRLIAAAERAAYQTRSGLDLDYEAATASVDADGSVVVRIPLRGTDLPEVSAVTFVHAEGRTDVSEIVARMVDDRHVAAAVWENGAQITNVVLERSDGASTMLTRGLSWSRLNSCLAGAGISWAIIAVLGVTCAAACAAVVACGSCIAVAAGFTGGTISGCVAKAWT